MEPDDTINDIRRRNVITGDDIRALQNLTKLFPKDAHLWDFLGDIVRLADYDSMPANYPLHCYLSALHANPEFGPAHESLGNWYDINENYALAKHHFERAIALGIGDPARVGLARILAQLRKDKDAYAVLNTCENPTSVDVEEVRREIADKLLGPYVDQLGDNNPPRPQNRMTGSDHRGV